MGELVLKSGVTVRSSNLSAICRDPSENAPCTQSSHRLSWRSTHYRTVGRGSVREGSRFPLRRKSRGQPVARPTTP
jgi:hypothetical protein